MRGVLWGICAPHFEHFAATGTPFTSHLSCISGPRWFMPINVNDGTQIVESQSAGFTFFVALSCVTRLRIPETFRENVIGCCRLVFLLYVAGTITFRSHAHECAAHTALVHFFAVSNSSTATFLQIHCGTGERGVCFVVCECSVFHVHGHPESPFVSVARLGLVCCVTGPPILWRSPSAGEQH